MGINKSGTIATPRLDLGEAIMEYMLEENELIGTRVLPIFPTNVKQASFSAITREGLTREADTKRAPRAEYNRDNVDTEDKSFECEEHGLEGLLDDGERAMYASDFDAELACTKGITTKLQLQQEKRIASLVLNTTTWTGASLYTDVSSAPWDTAGTNIISQVDAAKDKVRQNTGMRANAVIMGDAQIARIKANTDIKSRIQYVARLTEAEIINALKDLFGVQYVLIGGAVRNSAKHGQSFSGADVWSDDYVMIARIVTDPRNLSQPGLGRTMLWVEDSPENITVEQYREEKARSAVFRVRQHVDEVIIDPNFGHLLKVDA